MRWDKQDVVKLIMSNKIEETKRKRGRPKMRWMDCIEGVTGSVLFGRNDWRKFLSRLKLTQRCGEHT